MGFTPCRLNSHYKAWSYKKKKSGHILEFWAVFDINQKGHFFEKRAPKISPPPTYSIPFLSGLHQNKALYNFPKKGQRSIVECNIGLEYAL